MTRCSSGARGARGRRLTEFMRPQAVRKATRRIEGEVVFAAPLSSKVLSVLAITVVLGGAAFAASVTYTRRETVTGWVVPDGGLVRVSARQGGIITAIRRAEGEFVSEGEVFADLKLSSDLDSGDAGEALAAGVAAELFSANGQQKAARQRLHTQRGQLVSRQSALRRELLEAQERATLLEGKSQIAQRAVRRGEELLSRQYLSVAGLDNLRTTALNSAQEASIARSAVLSLQRQIADLAAELSLAQSDVMILDAKGAQETAALKQKQVATSAQSGVAVRAPIAGRLVAVPVELGQTVTGGATVGVLMPAGSALQAELFVPSRSSGFLREGQAVRLMYQAYPYQKFGSAPGRIESISRTVLSPGEVNVPGVNLTEPMFRVRVKMSRPSVSAYGQTFPVRPGMLLTADVILDRRNLVEWILDPLYAVGKRA